MKKVVVVLVMLVLIVGIFTVSHFGEGQAVAAIDVEATVIAAMKAQILASTVQIEMFDMGRIEEGLRHVRTSRGFGTVVQYEGRRFILTHNHWSIPAAELSRVAFRNGAGDGLLVLDGAAFYGLVRYADGGTMLLDAPVGLSEVSAAELGDRAALAVGDTVWLATYDYEDGIGVWIETAWIEEVEGSYVPGRLMLRGEETAVTSGDSGGGVWVDGKVVGNLWAIQVAKSEWLGGIERRRPIGSIVAGLEPLSGVIGLSADDLMLEPIGVTDFERGME